MLTLISIDLAVVLRGAAALQEALDLIGVHGVTDQDLAKVICDNEIGLRQLVAFSLYSRPMTTESRGPRLVCVGCGKETGVDDNPVCEDCVRAMWSFGESSENAPLNMLEDENAN
jgi:hypothetical protein